MAAVSALEPARRTCGGDGSAPSLDAGEPAALPPAAGPTVPGTTLGSPSPRPGPRDGRLDLAPGSSAPPALSPTTFGGQGWREGLLGAWEPPPGRASFALKLFAGVGRGSSARRKLPK